MIKVIFFCFPVLSREGWFPVLPPIMLCVKRTWSSIFVVYYRSVFGQHFMTCDQHMGIPYKITPDTIAGFGRFLWSFQSRIKQLIICRFFTPAPKRLQRPWVEWCWYSGCTCLAACRAVVTTLFGSFRNSSWSCTGVFDCWPAAYVRWP